MYSHSSSTALSLSALNRGLRALRSEPPGCYKAYIAYIAYRFFKHLCKMLHCKDLWPIFEEAIMNVPASLDKTNNL